MVQSPLIDAAGRGVVCALPTRTNQSILPLKWNLQSDICRRHMGIEAIFLVGRRRRRRTAAGTAGRKIPVGGGRQRWRGGGFALTLLMYIISPLDGSGSSQTTVDCSPMVPRIPVALEGNGGGGHADDVGDARMLSVSREPASHIVSLVAKGEGGGIAFRRDAQQMMGPAEMGLEMGGNTAVPVVAPLLPEVKQDTEIPHHHPPSPPPHLSHGQLQPQNIQAARKPRTKRPGDEAWPCASCGSIGVTWGVAAPVQQQQQEGQEAGNNVRPPWGRLLCSGCARSERREGTVGIMTLNRKCLLCTRSSTFGPEGGNRRDAVHCKVHRTIDEVDLVSIKCRSAGCMKHCMYGDPLEGPVPRYCAEHRENHHIDLKSKRCQAEGCGQRATHGYLPPEGEGAGGGRLALFCYEHKEETHVDLNKPTCDALCLDGRRCPRKPTFGDTGDRIVRYCAHHRQVGQVDLSNRRCEYPEGCTRRPLYPLEANRTENGVNRTPRLPGKAGGFPRAYCGAHWRCVMTPPHPGNGSAGEVGDVESGRGVRGANVQVGARMSEGRNRSSSISGPTEVSAGSTSRAEGLSGPGLLRSKAKPWRAPQEKQESLRSMPGRVAKLSRIEFKGAKKKCKALKAGGDVRGGMGKTGGDVGAGVSVGGHGLISKHKPPTLTPQTRGSA